MFERFTRSARVAVVLAQEEAREADSATLGAVHLLHGVLTERDGVPAAVLEPWGVDQAAVSRAIRSRSGPDALDADALAGLGIDLDEVRRRAEDAFGTGALDAPLRRTRWARRAGKGHIPFTDEAKGALEQALRAAVGSHDTSITDAHLLLGLLTVPPGTAYALLRSLGVTMTADELATEVRAHLRHAA